MRSNDSPWRPTTEIPKFMEFWYIGFHIVGAREKLVMKTLSRSVAIALGAMMLVTAAAGAQDQQRERYRVHKNNIIRRGSPFVIRAIERPGINSPTTTAEQRAIALRDISEVGANGVAFDLTGFSEDGGELSGQHIEAFRNLIGDANYRYMATICRLFGDDAPTDPAWRMRAAKTAAATLKKDSSVLYWIDGPGGARVVKAFRKLAPNLIVAAPKGGHVSLISSKERAKRKRPALVVGQITSSPSVVNCVLSAAKDSYERFDAAMAYPEEAQEWSADNSGLSPREREEGWLALFDGKTLNGWLVTGTNAEGWVVRDGTIVWGGPGGGYLRTRERYDDFKLKLEWRIKKDGNSGIMLRAPRANRSSKIGMEFQLMGDYGTPADPHGTGAVYSVLAPRENASKPHGEWNSVEITLDGPRFIAVLNGKTLHDLDLNEDAELRHRLRRGFIALQDHGRFVEFRNIRLKEL